MNIMKRILSIISGALLLMTAVSCDWFVLDNQDGWDAKVQGRILDSKTGQPVQSAQGSSAITVIEQGWKDPVSGEQITENQSWRIKNDGTYRNDLVFAGDYIMNTVSGANFMADPVNFTLKKGDNTVDFTVNPFCRIINPVITYEGGKIKATFAVEAGVSQVNNVGNVYLCVYPDRFVRNGMNKCEKDPGAHAINVNPDGKTQVTLVVDPEIVVNSVKVNADEFQYDRPHYIRIAAVGAHYGIVPEWTEEVSSYEFDMEGYLAAGSPEDWWNYYVEVITKVVHPAEYTNDGSINVSNAYNYSPVYKLENGTITEVTDW